VNFRVRYTRQAFNDLERLYGFLLEKDRGAAERALAAIRQGTDLVRAFPFSCRKADADNPFLRELLVPFGAAGYVMLFEIEDGQTVTILAVRHQWEEDYY
jgi:plasmid stabilization system protein ParE